MIFSLHRIRPAQKIIHDWPDFDIGYKAHPNRRDPETLEQIEDIPAQRFRAVHVNVLEFPSIQAFTTLM